jgi:hypothetical protein
MRKSGSGVTNAHFSEALIADLDVLASQYLWAAGLVESDCTCIDVALSCVRAVGPRGL